MALMEMYLEEISTRKVKASPKSCAARLFPSGSSPLWPVTSTPSFRPGGADGSKPEAYPHLFLDARYEKVRVGSRIVSQGVLMASALREPDGFGEVVAVEVADTEGEATYQELFRSLKGRVV